MVARDISGTILSASCVQAFSDQKVTFYNHLHHSFRPHGATRSLCQKRGSVNDRWYIWIAKI